MNHDVFISYSSKEKAVADGVCHYLEENGVRCWMAPRDIPAGTDYGDLIDEAIKACHVVVLVYSEAAFLSKWVKGEINVAFDEGKTIAPFRIDETTIKGAFRVMLNQMHWIDAYPSYTDRLPDLLRSVCGILGRPVPEAIAETQKEEELLQNDMVAKEEPRETFLKVRCNMECRVLIDGEERATAKPGNMAKIPLHKGEYVVMVSGLDGFDTIEQELTMPDGDKLLSFDLLALQKERLSKEEAERKAQKTEPVSKRERTGEKEIDIDKKYKAQGYTILGEGETRLDKSARMYAEIRKVKVAETITSIGESAFYLASELTSLVIPDTVEEIGEYAFTHVKNVIYHGKATGAPWGALSINGYIDNDFVYSDNKKTKVTAYIGNASNLTIPDTVVEIGHLAFHGCSSLTSITIPKSVKKIGDYAFGQCDNLKTVKLLNEKTEYAKWSLFDVKGNNGIESFPKHTKIIKG